MSEACSGRQSTRNTCDIARDKFMQETGARCASGSLGGLGACTCAYPDKGGYSRRCFACETGPPYRPSLAPLESALQDMLKGAVPRLRSCTTCCDTHDRHATGLANDVFRCRREAEMRRGKRETESARLVICKRKLRKQLIVLYV